jgi:hypothetical protein
MTKPAHHRVIEDPIVAEVRRAGEDMAREANYNLHTLCERLRQAERRYSGRLLDVPPQKKEKTSK